MPVRVFCVQDVDDYCHCLPAHLSLIPIKRAAASQSAPSVHCVQSLICNLSTQVTLATQQATKQATHENHFHENYDAQQIMEKKCRQLENCLMKSAAWLKKWALACAWRMKQEQTKVDDKTDDIHEYFFVSNQMNLFLSAIVIQILKQNFENIYK